MGESRHGMMGKVAAVMGGFLAERCALPSQRAAWLAADLNGWHSPDSSLAEDLLHLHSEVSEACEALRKGDMEGVEEELADVVLLALHVAEKNGFDLEQAVWDKHKKNIIRPHRHGEKKF